MKYGVFKNLCQLLTRDMFFSLSDGIADNPKLSPVKRDRAYFCSLHGIESVLDCSNFLMSFWMRIYYRKLHKEMAAQARRNNAD